MANPTNVDSRPVFFFDIDNCLYPRSKKVLEMMQDHIDEYFINHLSLSPKDAYDLHQRYYKDYGLAIAGLVLHHKINPLEFNREVDDALPLDDVIAPDPQLWQLLSDIDQTKVKLWLFTNAYVTHAERVMKLLGVRDFFEGITYCDYGAQPFLCKPHPAMYQKAEEQAGAPSPKDCYFVDDSYLNCRHAQTRGWTTAHLLEPSDPDPATQAAKFQIRSLEELRDLFPRFFVSWSSGSGE